MKAAIYVRISSDREGGGLGVARQEKDCRAKAAELGWDVLDVYMDNDLSAASGRPRPAYLRLLRDIESGHVNALIAWHADRLHRSPRELEHFIDVVEKHSVAVQTVTAGPLDLATPSGRLVARQLGSVARYEVEQTKLRIRAKVRDLAAAGKISGGGTRPFGYESDRRTIRESEAVLIRDAAARVLAGESIRGIAREWINDGVRTPSDGSWNARQVQRLLTDDDPDRARLRAEAAARVTGADAPLSPSQLARQWNNDGIGCPYRVLWSSQVVKELLRAPRAAGLREHQGAVLIKDGEPVRAEWPAILDRSTHERLRVLLDDPARNRRGLGAGRKYLLTGLVMCSRCGTKMVSRPAQKRSDGAVERVPSMVCASGPPFHGCGKLRIRADWLEDVVSAAVITALDGPALTELVRARETSGREADLQRELDDDRAALAEVNRDRYVRRVITDAEFVMIHDELTARIERTERQLAEALNRGALASVPSGKGALALAWPDWSLDRRRAVIDATVRTVAVLPGVRGRNKYTPEQLAERIVITWRDES